MSKMVTYQEISSAHGVVRMAETLLAAMRLPSVLGLEPGATLIGGERAPIEAGEVVNVLQVRDMRHGGKTDVFGEFKALIYTDDNRCAWVMPHQITIEPAEPVPAPNTNGLQVSYSDDGSTIWIALPRELWRPINGGCCCRYCSEDLTAKPAFWDTLAVAATKRKPGEANTTWTVHRPRQHGAEPLRSAEWVEK